MTWLLAMGCQVRGLIGSNETESAETGGTSAALTDATTGATVPISTTVTGVDATGTTEGSSSTADETTDEVVWDVQPHDVPEICAPPQTRWCDLDDDAWHHAMGFSCDDEYELMVDDNVQPGAMHVQSGPIGNTGTFVPQQSEKMVILSTGRASELPMTPEVLMGIRPECTPQTCPSTAVGDGTRMVVLPDPLQVRAVSTNGVDCYENPALVGEGDCSNTLEEHWVQGDGAYDYSELRVRATVPPHTDALQYKFAFFSSEYPLWIADTSFNDMYIAWLESEAWTGNISFDEMHNPITVHSVLLDYRSPSDQCPTCQAPELDGFAMREHAGTKWLTTRAPVETGETIQLVFAIFDLSDQAFDSAVLLDAFEWACADGPPITWAG